MNPLNLIPEPYRALLLAAAILIVLGATYATGHSNGAAGVRADWNAERLQLAQAAIEADRQAREKEHGWQIKYQGAVDDRTKAETALAAARAAALAADDRLRVARGEFERRLSEAPVEACRTAAGTAAALLGECSREYRAVAAAADGHAADVRQCEAAWPE